MNLCKCSLVEIKQPFNIFLWIREKDAKMVIKITTKVVDMLKNWIDIYYERVEMGVCKTILRCRSTPPAVSRYEISISNVRKEKLKKIQNEM